MFNKRILNEHISKIFNLAGRHHGANDGFVLIFTLYITVILITVSSAFVLRAIQESRTARKELDLTKSFYIAEGGTHAALDGLDNLINNYMYNTINSKNSITVARDAARYNLARDGVGFLVDYVKNNGQSVLTQNGYQAQYTTTGLISGENYQYNIFITEKTDPVYTAPDKWDFSYNYRIESTGMSGNLDKEVLLSGDFTVRVRKDNLAKYALFTDHHRLRDGTTVWFTNQTTFTGPVHTNDLFSFARNPSGDFGGFSTQQNSMARFYNRGWPRLIDAENNRPYDVPIFQQGFKRGADTIALQSSVQKLDVELQAKGGQPCLEQGIFIPNDGLNTTGGIFVRGNANVAMSINARGNAVYTITEGTVTKTITADLNSRQTTVSQSGHPDILLRGLPDGIDHAGTIIYVDGSIPSLSGTVQSDTELTIASERDVVIAGHIRYQNYNSAVGRAGESNYVPLNAKGYKNMLGLISWAGNVRIATSAPRNLDIHGIIMARNGVFSVDDYQNQRAGSKGTVTLLGGVMSQFYGAFGLFNGTTGQQISGYGRNFVYDNRTLLGQSPPYFPTLKTFVAFTNDITDKIVWQEGDS